MMSGNIGFSLAYIISCFNLIYCNKFTSPATWPRNLMFAIASFRLVERAIPTWDIKRHFGRSDAEQKREATEVVVNEVAGFSRKSCTWSTTVFPAIFLGCFGSEKPWHPAVAFQLHSFSSPSYLGGTCVFSGAMGRGAAGPGKSSGVEGKAPPNANWTFGWMMLNGSVFSPNGISYIGVLTSSVGVCENMSRKMSEGHLTSRHTLHSRYIT